MAADFITTLLMGCLSHPNSPPELVGAEKGRRCAGLNHALSSLMHFGLRSAGAPEWQGGFE